MSQADLNRIREDLATVRHAAGLELPFGNQEVRAHLWSAACGVIMTLWAVFAPWEYRWGIAVPIAAAVAITLRTTAEARRRRESARWREYRLSSAAVLVAAPLAIAYLYWERWSGMPRAMAGAASVFFFGLGALVFALLDRRRFYYAGGAIPFMIFGALIPFCSPQQVLIAGSVCWAVGGLAVAGIQSWQLHLDGTQHGAD